MGLTAEFGHQIEEAQKRDDVVSAAFFGAQLQSLRTVVDIGVIKEAPPKTDGSSSELVLPSAEQLVASAKKELEAFFGKEIHVPEPPQELFEDARSLSEFGVAKIEAHYLPKHVLKENGKLPGWKVKLEPWFWAMIKEAKISAKAATLEAGWYLIPGTGKPDYYNGDQMYEDNYLGSLIGELRIKKKIEAPRNVSTESMFGISTDELEGIIVPELRKRAGVKGELRSRRAGEFNVIGNMAHPEWGQTDTWEWFGDKFGGGSRLVGGYSGSGGLASVRCGWSDVHFGGVGVGLLVAYPSKTR